MVLLVDSREKWTQSGSKDKHIKNYFEKHNIQYEVRKLDEGDYQILGQPNLTVDRKYGLQEVYSCLTAEKCRFMREVRRCYEKGIKLVVLIEQRGYSTISDVVEWQPKYGTLSGREIANRMFRLHMGYGVEFVFCDKRSAAKKICEILNYSCKTEENAL